jgi:hypothetical protein
MELVLSLLVLFLLILLTLWYFLFRKAEQLQHRLNHEMQTIRYELTTRAGRLELAQYQQLPGREIIRYELSGRNAQEDFTGKGAAAWDYIHHRFAEGAGSGAHQLTDNFLQINRTNQKGRYELYLETYFFDSVTHQIPIDTTISERHLRITGEVKKNGASHILRFVFKGESQNVLDEKDYVVFSPDWEPFDLVFTISSNEASHLRMDDFSVLDVPSSVQIRNLKLIEKR